MRGGRSPIARRLSVWSLEQHRDPHSTTDTQAAIPQRHWRRAMPEEHSSDLEESNGDARPACPHRVPEGDSPAIYVYPSLVPLQVYAHRNALSGEGLVELDEIDLVQRHSRTLQKTSDRRGRSDPHDLGIHTGLR